MIELHLTDKDVIYFGVMIVLLAVIMFAHAWDAGRH